jgi:hypothetical protein
MTKVFILACIGIASVISEIQWKVWKRGGLLKPSAAFRIQLSSLQQLDEEI